MATTDFETARSSESQYRKSLVHLNELLRHGGTLSGHEANCAFLNTHGGSFATISAISGFDFLDDARGVALTDWDSDGDVDIWTSNRTAPRVRFLRNEIPDANHFIAFQLEGRTCNRDAIGARVEVDDRSQTWRSIKSLRAGEGYLSQSSKWLSFGLGKAEGAVNITVHWPDGTKQRHADLAVDQHYVIVQGRADARRWQRERKGSDTRLAIRPGSLSIPAATERARVPLVQRIPLPRLPRTGGEGAASDSSGRPRLVNLWATWCGPCLQELAELTQRADDIRAAQIDVLAINVDSVVPNQSEATHDAAKLLAELKFPFASAAADDELIERVRWIHEMPFAVHVDLSVPTSFLVDAQGRVAVIYRGPIQIDQLLADVGQLKLDGPPWLQAALPLPGRWNETPSPRLTLRVARELIQRQQLDDAVDYVTRFRADMEEVSEFATLLVALGDELVAAGRAAEGLKQYGGALEVDPQHVTAMNNLAWQLATHSDPSVRDGGLAVRWAERATRLTKARDIGILDTLAASYAEADRFADAVKAAERAIQVAGPSTDPLVQRIRRRLDGYRKGEAFRAESSQADSSRLTP